MFPANLVLINFQLHHCQKIVSNVQETLSSKNTVFSLCELKFFLLDRSLKYLYQLVYIYRVIK